jgi:hypothetical protein
VGLQRKHKFPEANSRAHDHFNHVFLTGKYDPVAQTGHPEWLGHNGGENMDQPDYYERYGMWGHPRWSGMRFHENNRVSNIVRILNFKSTKISYVATSEGGFAGFNVKTDHPTVPERLKVDIQDCFSAWIESEAVYISWSDGAVDKNLTELILRNNIFAYNGCETIQSDNLTNGSIIETTSALRERPSIADLSRANSKMDSTSFLLSRVESWFATTS